MTRWYVNVDHLTDAELEVFGWYKAAEDDEFVVYCRAYGDDEQVVDKAKKFLLIDDWNDAKQMGTFRIRAPTDQTSH